MHVCVRVLQAACSRVKILMDGVLSSYPGFDRTDLKAAMPEERPTGERDE